MSTFEKFKKLEMPVSRNKVFTAITLEQFQFAKVAKNNFGQPIILIQSSNGGKPIRQKNLRLKYIELTHNVQCNISENNESKTQSFSIIKFNSNDITLQEYFFNISDNFLKELSQNPSEKELSSIFKGFVEVFRVLSNPPKSSIQGLWSELVLILNGSKTDQLINYWHNRPDEKFDFNADIEKIEVKSSSTLERVHFFTSEQLNPESHKKVLIASIFVKQSSNGLSISDLLGKIEKQIEDDSIIEKLYSIVSKTLGSKLEQGLKIKFDYELAKNSLAFYDSRSISKIEKVAIPHKVTNVKYKSDLTKTKPLKKEEIKGDGLLFTSI